MTMEPNDTLTYRPCDDDVFEENLLNLHKKAVWPVTLAGWSQADEPIVTDEGKDLAPKFEPVTVTVPPSRDRGEENEDKKGKS